MLNICMIGLGAMFLQFLFHYLVQLQEAKYFIFVPSTVSKLSPKKWGLSGSSSVVLAGFFAGVSFLLTQGIDIRPNLAVVLGLAMADSILLGGSCLAQISSYWPPYRRRILVHEAGHLLIGKTYITGLQLNL